MVIFILTIIDMFHTVLDIAFNDKNFKWHLTKKVCKD